MKNRLRNSAFGIFHHIKLPSNRGSLFLDPDAQSDWPGVVADLIPLFALLAIVFIGVTSPVTRRGLPKVSVMPPRSVR